MKRIIFVFILAVLFFAGCGIDKYAYLFPIPQENIIRSADLTTTVIIPYQNNPAINSSSVFTHFTIFYRIYMSGVYIDNPTLGDLASINPALSSHYNAIDYYNPSSERIFSASLLESLFKGRGYKYLCLQGASLDFLLSSATLFIVPNCRLRFDFSYANRPPKMSIMSGNTLIGSEYTLLRSDDLKLPMPNGDSRFINFPELCSPIYATSDHNADIEPNSSPIYYTYAAMFIMAAGLDVENGYIPVYSNPTFIHAIRLPAPI